MWSMHRNWWAKVITAARRVIWTWALTYVWDKITPTLSMGRKTAQIGVISILTPVQQVLLPELNSWREF